ncbi:MDIS1-interacting receptor like kinase 2-like [Neltuma alba]|uniref:MDIS1-interacting receptor like kinase 2-like n=1 Tax=Neltuma alba TaxID=207710 RepID=UPI0010A38B5A|nr:MDIS1-interacting receptor like kinase 2-like [Prosopis alba]
MERGSLPDMLRNDKEVSKLDWSKRFNIIKWVAQALSYMYNDCNPPIVHRDISSKNILLSSNLEAHVSDFGRTRFLKPDSSIWTTFASTYGYTALDQLQRDSGPSFIINKSAKLEEIGFDLASGSSMLTSKPSCSSSDVQSCTIDGDGECS